MGRREALRKCMCTAMPVLCLAIYLLFSAVVLGGDKEVSFQTDVVTRI